MNPFRLVLLNEFFYPDFFGGTGKVLSDLARRLQDEHGIQVTAITSARAYRNNDETLPEVDDWNGIAIHRITAAKSRVSDLSQRLKSDLELTKSAAHKVKGIPCDGILVTTSPPLMPLAAWWLKKTRGIPYWYIIYDLEPDRAVVVGVADAGSWKTKLLGWWQRKWMHQAERVVVLGRCMKDHVQRAYSLPSEKLEVIATGDDDEAIKPMQKGSAFRAGLPSDGFLALYSGNFGRYHDFTPILDAAEDLKPDPRFRFLLVGGGHKRDEVKAEAAARGLTNVEVRGFVEPEEYPCLLAAADASIVTLEEKMEGLCVPSKFYSFLASGRPVLALMKPHAEVALVVAEEGCGRVVNSEMRGELARVLTELAAERRELEEMGAKARRALEEKYSSRRIAERFAALIKKERKG